MLAAQTSIGERGERGGNGESGGDEGNELEKLDVIRKQWFTASLNCFNDVSKGSRRQRTGWLMWLVSNSRTTRRNDITASKRTLVGVLMLFGPKVSSRRSTSIDELSSSQRVRANAA